MNNDSSEGRQEAADARRKDRGSKGRSDVRFGGGGMSPSRAVSARSSPWVDGAVVYGVFLGTFLLASWIARQVPRSQAAAVTLDLVPYLVIFAFVNWRRSGGHPLFPIGSPGFLFGRASILWLLAGGIATYTAYRHGAFGPHSMAWRANNFINDPLEAPFAEEFAFRGAIMTALNATRLGKQGFFGFRLGTLVSAMAFAAMHLLALLDGMPLSYAPLFVASALLAGLVFGSLYQRTQNLWYGILIHALGNFSQVLP
jgi:membrane protease YdiL (CAAX protease family)